MLRSVEIKRDAITDEQHLLREAQNKAMSNDELTRGYAEIYFKRQSIIALHVLARHYAKANRHRSAFYTMALAYFEYVYNRDQLKTKYGYKDEFLNKFMVETLSYISHTKYKKGVLSDFYLQALNYYQNMQPKPTKDFSSFLFIYIPIYNACSKNKINASDILSMMKKALHLSDEQLQSIKDKGRDLIPAFVGGSRSTLFSARDKERQATTTVKYHSPAPAPLSATKR